jgi:hypothetical protein
MYTVAALQLSELPALHTIGSLKAFEDYCSRTTHLANEPDSNG